MESTRPIRALARGLDVLAILNLRGAVTVAEVAQEIRLPRTTVYRILETLSESGFVHRDGSDDRYRLTIRVRGLSGGFDDEPWVTQIVRPLLLELSREVVWPVAIATLSGKAMLLRETTDHMSPVATERYSAGVRVPVLTSATGLAYLAHCGTEQRNALIDLVWNSVKAEERFTGSRNELQQALSEIRTRGYAVQSRSRRHSEDIALSVPVMLDGSGFAALSIRFAAAALPLPVAVARFPPKLRECAGRISQVFSETQAAAPNKGAFEAAV
jgi:IclR family mhp operon transcriptional activator